MGRLQFQEPGASSGKGRKLRFSDKDYTKLYECGGWDLYRKMVNVKVEDTYLYKVVKKKDTAVNKDEWKNILGQMSVDCGFKWNRTDSTFERWSKSLLGDDNRQSLCAILERYYGRPAQPAPAPQPTTMPTSTPTPSQPASQQQGEPSGRVMYDLEIYFHFDTPTELNAYKNGELVEYKKEVLKEIERLVVDVAEKNGANSRGDSDFIKKYLIKNFTFRNPISNTFDTIFSTRHPNSDQYEFALTNILRIGGLPQSIISEVLNEVKVNIDGESEGEFVGGLLSYLPYYGIIGALQIATNFAYDHYAASFKYPHVTDKFRDFFNSIEVEINDFDYKNNPIVLKTTLFYKVFDDGRYIYFLSEKNGNGGYMSMYSNDFMISYSTVMRMLNKQDDLLSYVKDVDPFGESLANASRYWSQIYPLLPDYPTKKSTSAISAQYTIEQDIEDIELLMSLETDPVEYAKLQQELDDLKHLQSLS